MAGVIDHLVTQVLDVAGSNVLESRRCDGDAAGLVEIEESHLASAITEAPELNALWGDRAAEMVPLRPGHRLESDRSSFLKTKVTAKTSGDRGGAHAPAATKSGKKEKAYQSPN